MATKNVYDKAVESGSEMKATLPKQRDAVIKELSDLGAAFVSLLGQKFKLPDVRHEVVSLKADVNNSSFDVVSSNVMILQIVMGELSPDVMPIVTCAFEPEKTYPCVLSVPFAEASVACSTLTEVRKTLVSFCDAIGSALTKKIESLKKGCDALMKNDALLATTPDVGLNS